MNRLVFYTITYSKIYKLVFFNSIYNMNSKTGMYQNTINY